jgi:hypothetical protein
MAPLRWIDFERDGAGCIIDTNRLFGNLALAMVDAAEAAQAVARFTGASSGLASHAKLATVTNKHTGVHSG